jgi:hypothetical protein
VRTRVLVLVFSGISVLSSPLSESLPLLSNRVNRKPRWCQSSLEMSPFCFVVDRWPCPKRSPAEPEGRSAWGEAEGKANEGRVATPAAWDADSRTLNAYPTIGGALRVAPACGANIATDGIQLMRDCRREVRGVLKRICRAAEGLQDSSQFG